MTTVIAEPGMGKTRLLAEAAEEVRRRGALTLAGGCYEGEGQLPYGPIHDALLDYVEQEPDEVWRDVLGSALPEVSRILPEIRRYATGLTESTVSANQRLGLFLGITQVLDRITQQSPLVLILDDLQWADHETLHLLHFVLRQPGLGRLLVLGACREGEVTEGSVLDTLLSVGNAEQIALGPMDPEPFAELIQRFHGGMLPRQFMEALYERSGGNPFFAREIVQVLQKEGELGPNEAGWETMHELPQTLPKAVRQTIEHRLHKLGDDEREALDLSAILGREFDYRVLETIWDGPERLLFRALEEAVRSQILAQNELGYAFRHPLLWEVVYGGISAPRRILLHRSAITALRQIYGERADAHATELVRHVLAAGPEHVDDAIHFLLLAGDEAELKFAHADAERYFRTALQVAHDRDDDQARAHALDKLSAVLRVGARYGEAIELLQQAAHVYHALEDTQEQIRVVAEMGGCYLQGGHTEDGIRVIRAFLSTLEPEVRDPRLAIVYGSLAGLLHGSGHFEEQLQMTERALELASEGHDEALILDAQAAHGLALINVGRLDEGLRLLEDVIPIAEFRQDLAMLHFAISSVAWVYQARGEFERSKHLLQQLHGVAEREMNVTRTAYALNSLGRNAFFIGNWTEAQEYIEKAYALCRNAGLSWVAPYPPFELGRLSLARGNWANARCYLEECIGVAKEIGDLPALRSGERLLAELDLLHGDPKAAIQRLSPLHEGMSTNEVDAAYLIPTLAEAYMDAEEYNQAQHLLTSFLQTDSDHYPRMGLMEGLRVQGLLLSRQDCWEDAQSAFERALTLVPTYPYGRARVLYAHAESYMRAGNTAEVHELLTEALTLFRRLGAEHWRQLTEGKLRELSPGLVPTEN